MRHGESTFNAAEKMGRDIKMDDPPLSPLGERQVQEAAERIKKGAVRKIISSPFTRAIQTAKIVAAVLDLPITVDFLVSERRLYSCDIGSSINELQKRFPDLDFSRMPEEKEWWLPFPESDKSLRQRIAAFQAEWGWQDEADKTLVVSHYYFIQAILGAWIDNAEIAPG